MHVGLRTDHVLGRRDELLCEPTMGDQYETDHEPLRKVAD